MSSSRDLSQFHNRVERKKVAWAIINDAASQRSVADCLSRRVCLLVGMSRGPPWCDDGYTWLGQSISWHGFCHGCRQNRNGNHAPHIRLASYLVTLPSRKSEQMQFSNWRYYNENWRCHHGHGAVMHHEHKWCRHVRNTPFILCERHRYSVYWWNVRKARREVVPYWVEYQTTTAGQYYYMLQCCIRVGLHPDIVRHVLAPILLKQGALFPS